MKYLNSKLIISAILLATTINATADITIVGELTEAEKNDKLCEALYFAAAKANLEKVSRLINQGANVNCSGSDEGYRVLHSAVSMANFFESVNICKPPIDLVNKKLEVVKLLLDYGADVNARNFKGETALHTTWVKEIAELLIKYGADVHAQDVNGSTPLLHSKSSSRSGCQLGRNFAELLIQHGADVNHQSNYGDTVLRSAVSAGNLDDVKFLIDKGADINFHNNEKDSILERAIRSSVMSANRNAIAEYLITKGAFFVNGYDSDAFSELHLAVKQNNLRLVKVILSNGSAVDYPDKYGNTAILGAIHNNNKKIAKLLISYGADVNVIDRTLGGKPLFFSAKDEEMLDLLLKSGVDVTATGYSESTYHRYIENPKLLSLIKSYETKNKYILQ